jgi:hypothetical protein
LKAKLQRVLSGLLHLKEFIHTEHAWNQSSLFEVDAARLDLIAGNQEFDKGTIMMLARRFPISRRLSKLSPRPE